MDVEEWFNKYRTTLAKYSIKRGKDIHNINELDARVRCLCEQCYIKPFGPKFYITWLDIEMQLYEVHREKLEIKENDCLVQFPQRSNSTPVEE
jgi:hypothetical protein